MEELKKTFSCDIIPTPAAVLQFLENVQDCFPSSMLVDIGGATTDVHSVCENMLYEKKCFLEGLEEPFSKRTVEGDLGMRYSAPSVWENFSKSPDFGRNGVETVLSVSESSSSFCSKGKERKTD